MVDRDGVLQGVLRLNACSPGRVKRWWPTAWTGTSIAFHIGDRAADAAHASSAPDLIAAPVTNITAPLVELLKVEAVLDHAKERESARPAQARPACARIGPVRPGVEVGARNRGLNGWR